MALLEMAGEQRKAGEQAEQVGDSDPFVPKVAKETRHANAGFEAGEQDLVEADRGQPGQSDVKRSVMEKRHAQQGQREKDEIDGNPGDCWRVASRHGGGWQQAQQGQNQAVHKLFSRVLEKGPRRTSLSPLSSGAG